MSDRVRKLRDRLSFLDKEGRCNTDWYVQRFAADYADLQARLKQLEAASKKDKSAQELLKLVQVEAERVQIWGKELHRMYSQLQNSYDCWQDKFIELDKALYEAEQEAGITKEEIFKFSDPMDNLFDL